MLLETVGGAEREKECQRKWKKRKKGKKERVEGKEVHTYVVKERGSERERVKERE